MTNEPNPQPLDPYGGPEDDTDPDEDDLDAWVLDYRRGHGLRVDEQNDPAFEVHGDSVSVV